MPTYPDIKLFINGAWRQTKETLPIINPGDEKEIGRLPVASETDMADALAAAEAGFKIWRDTAPRTRGQIILKAAQLLRARQEEIAYSIALELGKPISQARLEVVRGCEFFEWDAAEAQRLYGRVIPSAPGMRFIVIRQPIGCVAAFSPWNFPMSQPARKVAAALAAGCAIVLKAAEDTPAGAVHVAQAFADAGLPKGVLNLVFGQPAEISNYLIPQQSIRLVAFTGSTKVGKQLAAMAAKSMTPVLMELGGHAPVIVCADSDAGAVADASAVGKFRNAGQVCTSPTRFYVHENLCQPFTESFVKRSQAMRIGDALDEKTEMGPLAHKGRLEALQGFVDDAVTRGAKLLTGGRRRSDKGYFFEPTVLAEVPKEAQVLREEPFGPIAIINPVASLDQAISEANSVDYGLAAYAFTHSAANVEALVDGVEAGNLSINTFQASVAETPFGGVKASGYGREGGEEGLQHYTLVKNVSHQLAP